MKSLFNEIDNLLRFLTNFSRDIDSAKGKIVSRIVLNDLPKLVQRIEELVVEIRDDDKLKLLENSNRPEIIDFVRKFKIILNKVDSIIATLKGDIESLILALKGECDDWKVALADLHMSIIMSGLDEEEGEMKKFRELEIVQLRTLINDKNVEPRIFEAEKYIINLFKD